MSQAVISLSSSRLQLLIFVFFLYVIQLISANLLIILFFLNSFQSSSLAQSNICIISEVVLLTKQETWQDFMQRQVQNIKIGLLTELERQNERKPRVQQDTSDCTFVRLHSQFGCQ